MMKSTSQSFQQIKKSMKLLELLVISEAVKAKDIDTDIRKWANENNVEIEQAKKEYRQIYRELKDDFENDEIDKTEQHKQIMDSMGFYSVRGGGKLNKSEHGKLFKQTEHGTVDEIVAEIKKHAPTAGDYLKKTGNPPIWRGEITREITRGKTVDTTTGRRMSAHSQTNIYTLLLDEHPSSSKHAKRQQSIIGTPKKDVAEKFKKITPGFKGGALIGLFPYENSKISTSRETDMWRTTIRINKFKSDPEDIKGLTQNVYHAGFKLIDLDNLLFNGEMGVWTGTMYPEKFESLAKLEHYMMDNYINVYFNMKYGSRISIKILDEMIHKNFKSSNDCDEVIKIINARKANLSYTLLSKFLNEHTLSTQFLQKMKKAVKTLLDDLKKFITFDNIETTTVKGSELNTVLVHKFHDSEIWIEGKTIIVPEKLINEVKSKL